MASDAGVRNIEQLAQFGKNIKSLGQNMYQTMQVAQQRMNRRHPLRRGIQQKCAGHKKDVRDVHRIF